MGYVAIPIDFDRPDVPSALRFFDLLRAQRDRRVFVHCAANKRVSALIFAFRKVEGARDGTPEGEAAARDLARLWEPNETWRRYIDDVVVAATAAAAAPTR
jgi:hypothetical protein